MYYRLLLAAFAGLAFSVAYADDWPERSDGFDVSESADALQDFMDEPAQFGFPRLSPSGRYLAFVSATLPEGDDSEVQRYLLITDLDGEDARQIVSLSGLRPNWLYWASEDRLLVGAAFEVQLRGRSRRLYQHLNPTASRVLSFSRNLGEEPAILFANASARMQSANWRLSSITDYMTDDPDHVLMPADYNGRYSLWRVNILTGEAEIYEEGERRTVGWHTVDGVPVMRLDMSRRGRRMFIYTRSDAESEWERTLTIRRRDVQQQQSETDFEWAGETETPGQIYVRAQPEGSDFIGIHRYDLETGAFLDVVAEREDYDIGAALVDDWSGEFLGYSFVADRQEFKFTDSRFEAHYRGLLNFFGDQIEVYPWSFGGDRMVVRVSGPTEIGSYYLYNFAESRIDLLSVIWAGAANIRTFEMQPVSFTARDGLALSGYVTWPEAGPSPQTPLVVMPHGGPEARDSIAFDFLPQYLANQGYAVFQPNFRGSYGFGSSFRQAGHRQWGLTMQDDIEDGVRQLLASDQIDPDRICIVGFSYGGYAALSGMARSPDLYKCAVAGGSVTDLRRFLDFKEDISDDVDDYWAELIGDRRDRDQRPRLDGTSPVNQAELMRGPILLMHGEDDRAVPVRQSRDMAEALEVAGVPHVYLEEPAGRHGWGSTDDNYRIAIENIAAFLDDAMDGSIDRFQAVAPRDPSESD